MATLIPDEKWLILFGAQYFWMVQNETGYHPGPGLPSRADVAQL